MRNDREDGVDRLPDRELAVRIEESVKRRAALLQAGVSNSVRLVHDEADRVPGVVVEKFADTLIVQHHEGRAAAGLDSLRGAIEGIMANVSATAAYLKRFPIDRSTAGDLDTAHRNAAPWIGRPVDEEFAIQENGLSFLIRSFDGFSAGLFLEHRDNRALVMSLAAGKRVLNLFSYTCGFSIAAAAGGASEVTSVDLSARFLDWGRRNFESNGLAVEEHRFIRDDALKFYERAKRQDRDYDLIVIDPPTFARIKKPKSVFVLAERIDDVLAGAVDRLRPGGRILFATNDRRLTHRVVEAAMHTASGKRRIMDIEWLKLPEDFAGDPDYSRSVLVTIR